MKMFSLETWICWFWFKSFAQDKMKIILYCISVVTGRSLTTRNMYEKLLDMFTLDSYVSLLDSSWWCSFTKFNLITIFAQDKRVYMRQDEFCERDHHRDSHSPAPAGIHIDWFVFKWKEVLYKYFVVVNLHSLGWIRSSRDIKFEKLFSLYLIIFEFDLI